MVFGLNGRNGLRATPQNVVLNRNVAKDFVTILNPKQREITVLDILKKTLLVVSWTLSHAQVTWFCVFVLKSSFHVTNI